MGRAPQNLREVLILTGKSGVRMALATTEPAVQVYDGRGAMRPGHGFYESLAIEAQNWPDAPNKAGFPSIELRPGDRYAQTTEWRLSL
jgi:aldose 1-epimerase